MTILPAPFGIHIRGPVPMKPEDYDHVLEGLRKAGMPEE